MPVAVRVAEPGMDGVEVTEVADGVYRLALPLGIHGVPTVSAYLLRGDDGDTLVDCGIAAGVDGGDPGPDGTAAVSAALAAAGSALERLERLVVTHAHIDHFGLAGEVVRRSGGELWMHRRTDLDLAKYDDPDEAVDRRTLMLADHGLYGTELTESSEGLRDWLPVMPSIGRPSRLLDGGRAASPPAAGRGRSCTRPGHSPGHVCLWNAEERLLCSGDHLLQVVSPPVTFERGFEPDPMGSYLESLDRVRDLAPELVLPGPRDAVPRRGPAGRGDRRGQAAAADAGAASWSTARTRTVPELTADLFGSAPLTGAQRHFVTAEILAYLAYHEARRVLRRTRRPDGVFLWSMDEQPEEAT